VFDLSVESSKIIIIEASSIEQDYYHGNVEYRAKLLSLERRVSSEIIIIEASSLERNYYHSSVESRAKLLSLKR
jgi:hypothetical protein